MRILTIGGYGFTEGSFIEALHRAQVDVFVDIRQRRGLRGRRYSFLNSVRLQELLAAAGIRYVHMPELAPTSAIREMQVSADEEFNVLKRNRQELSPAFTHSYERDILGKFELQEFLNCVGSANAVALFCVESSPTACHRSLAAKFIASRIGVDVEHID